MKALIVSWGKPYPEQQALWEQVAKNGSDLTYIHSEPVSGSNGSTVPQSSPLSVTYLTLPIVRVRTGPTWWWYRGLRNVVSQRKPDVLHVLMEPWSMFVLQSLIVRGTRRDTSVVAHGCDNIFTHGTGLARRGRAAMLRVTLPRLDGYLSWNEDGATLARRFGLPFERPALVVPGIIPDPSLFQPGSLSQAEARERFELPRDGLVIGFLGRLVEEKGIHDLLSAVEPLDSSVYCAVWGEGNLDHEVQSYFARHPTRGRLLGAIPLSTVPEALRACDLVVVPSRTIPTWMEQFGRVAAEALLAGVPVVAYASGALPEVIGNAGLLVEEGDIGGLTHALATLISDPKRRLALSALGRERALERFSPGVLADQVLDFWVRAMTVRASTHAG